MYTKRIEHCETLCQVIIRAWQIMIPIHIFGLEQLKLNTTATDSGAVNEINLFYLKKSNCCVEEKKGYKKFKIIINWPEKPET